MQRGRELRLGPDPASSSVSRLPNLQNGEEILLLFKTHGLGYLLWKPTQTKASVDTWRPFTTTRREGRRFTFFIYVEKMNHPLPCL